MSRKDKKTIVNNIQELNLEIDYDKLADAIVKVDKKRAEEEANDPTAKVFTSISSDMLKATASACLLVAVLLTARVISTCSALEWNTVQQILGYIIALIPLPLGVVAIVVFCIKVLRFSKVIESVKDKNYTISIFSALVSFAALIVALIALFKGVG